MKDINTRVPVMLVTFAFESLDFNVPCRISWKGNKGTRQLPELISMIHPKTKETIYFKPCGNVEGKPMYFQKKDKS